MHLLVRRTLQPRAVTVLDATAVEENYVTGHLAVNSRLMRAMKWSAPSCSKKRVP